MQRWILACTLLFYSLTFPLVIFGVDVVSETVFVEAPIDTNGDNKDDLIYVKIDRPSTSSAVPSIIHMSPYALGGNSVENHNVNLSFLPQDLAVPDFAKSLADDLKSNRQSFVSPVGDDATARGYASVVVHSVGTGKSAGCPTVGDESEAIAGKAVIDWLNGRARARNANGTYVEASWSNGSVGMTGVSYDGTLPNMIATTGVEGLKAIVPIAAISNWYDYYRANGLVVGPGGYIGEDADILADFILRPGANCQTQLAKLREQMGREHGDFSDFWQARNYLGKASQVKAAVFIIHGQSDWNVKQRHAIQWWKSLDGIVPRRMWLHKGGHGTATRSDTSAQIWAWFDRYVKGVENGVENKAKVEVESPSGQWSSQGKWPHESTNLQRLYLTSNRVLSAEANTSEARLRIIDNGRSTPMETLIARPTSNSASRIALTGTSLTKATLISGTVNIQLKLAVLNRRAANISVALVDYDAQNRGQIVTRGWVDPQNHENIEVGELLDRDRDYTIRFSLVPKQYTFARGHKIGVVLASTDYDYTIRPKSGTQIDFVLGSGSFMELMLR